MGYEHTRSPVAKLQSRPTSGVSYGLSLRDSRMVIGMKEGIFTGVKLSTYFNAAKKDPLNARRIINGIDQQQRIAGMYEKFLAGLKLAV